MCLFFRKIAEWRLKNVATPIKMDTYTFHPQVERQRNGVRATGFFAKKLLGQWDRLFRDKRRQVLGEAGGEVGGGLGCGCFIGADSGHYTDHRAVAAASGYAVEDGIDLVAVFASLGAATALVPIDHHFVVDAVFDEVAVGLKSAAVRCSDADLLRITEDPTGARQAVLRTVISRTRTLREVVADVNIGKASVRQRVFAHRVVGRSKDVFDLFVELDLASLLPPIAEPRRNFRQRTAGGLSFAAGRKPVDKQATQDESSDQG